MLLKGLSHGEIVSELNDYFTDEELEFVATRLPELIESSETLDELMDKIDEYLVDNEE